MLLEVEEQKSQETWILLETYKQYYWRLHKDVNFNVGDNWEKYSRPVPNYEHCILFSLRAVYREQV
jgi:hypothetical protein